MINNSVMKCCICNNEKIGEFITINDKKYHLCCIEQLKKQKDDVVEYIKENKDKTIMPYGDNEDTDYEICLFEDDINEILRMLGEIDEYQEKN